MSKRAKWITFGAVVLGIAGFAGMTAARKGQKPVAVRIEAVEKRDLVSSVTASGQVQPRTKVDVASDVTGRIVRLAVKEGQMVTKGQFLLQIDLEQARAQFERTQAALSSAKARSAQARANSVQSRRGLERSEEIKKSNPQLISDEQLEQLRTQAEVNEALLQAAQHEVEQSEAAMRDARQALGKTTIVAPMSGRITRLNVEEGETAIMGTLNKDAATLLTIADMSVLETKVKVDETDVARISIGDSAIVEIDAFPDTTFIGRVTEISNSSIKGATTQQASDQAVDYEITIQLVNAPTDTRPDFSATAKIVTDARQQALSIPIIALTVREDEKVGGDTAVVPGGRQPAKQIGKRDVEGVFVVGKDNRVTFRPVKVGIAGEKYFEVVNGLQTGERIVAGTYQAIRELKDSTLVKPQDEGGDKKKTEKK
jgi:HlyD family secretion protein